MQYKFILVKSKFFFFFLNEVKTSLSLRMLGFGLALTHILTFFYWTQGSLPRKLVSDDLRICWSFFQNCEAFNFFTPSNIQFIFYFYLLLSIFTAICYLNKKTVEIATLLLILITLLKGAIFIQDYRFMGNYHYMPFWMTATFILSPRKKEACSLLLVLFYVGAGLLKFNVEWLSGAAMIRPPIITGKLLEWGTAFVVILEMFFVFWFFSQQLWKRVFALSLIALFHLFSWHIVGFFYPLVMFSMLLLIAFSLKTGVRLNWKRPGFLIFPTLFAIAQLLPFMFFSNSAVTGAGRILSLNMFDAKTICQSEIIYKNKNTFIQLPLLLNDLGVRIGCDPLVHFEQAKHYCRKINTEKPDTISIHMVTKSTSSDQVIQTLSIDDVCHNPPKITIWGEFK